MKLPIEALAVAAFLSANALAKTSTWPEAPKLILTPYEAADCKTGRGIGASPLDVEVPPNQCVEFPLIKSYRAMLATKPRDQTCILTHFTGSGCQLSPQFNDQLDMYHPKSCFDTNLPYGWLGGGNEASWSVMYNCNLDGY